ncbi:MAG: ATP-binding protein [bacterium]
MKKQETNAMPLPKDVLIVEDSATQAAVLKSALEGHGWCVRVARDGVMALEMARLSKPDIVVSDIRMPKMDGYALSKAIKTDPALHDVPVVLFTSLSQSSDIVHAINSRADYYFLKQWDHDDLIAKIASVLDTYQPLSDHGQDGLTVRFEGKAYTIEANAHQPLSLLLSTYEIAVQQSLKLAAARDKLREASEFAESVINTVREPLISLDQDLRVVAVNRSFCAFFKVKPEETVGQLVYDLGNGQWNIPKLRELLETILPQKTTFDNYEVEHDFSTIGRRIMLLNARQIQRGFGKERIILLAIEDITERKEIEAGLENAHEELSRAARAKTEFLANMSHELRTPLNSINGFSEVLYDETFGPLNEKQKKYVTNVLVSGKHLILLINQILDMAKVESGKMTLALSSLPLKSLLHEMALLVADVVGKKKLQMVLEIAEDLPSIDADELKVKQIIYNLLSNAVKFSADGGTIGMQARKADSEIEIVVWDKGIGIAPENMEKIFEGFFRVNTPYSRVTEGTGLGLPLSRKLVELHGGKLAAESEGLNKGTSVRFTLPIVARKEP